MPAERLVMDGEMIVVVDGVQEFDLLGQRIHPAESRVEMLPSRRPPRSWPSTCWRRATRCCCELPYDERRERLAAVVDDPVELTPVTDDRDAAAAQWLAGNVRGRDREAGRAPLPAGRAHRHGEDQARPHRRRRRGRVPLRQGGGHRRLADPRACTTTTASCTWSATRRASRAKQKRELIGFLEPYRTGERGSGEPSRWKSDEELVWEGLRPELVVEVALRPHHRQPDPPRREVPALARRQGAERVPISQLRD